ncbi:MAG: hypothetical protein LJE56_06320, partial [Acidiferrobacterales bacterium]|nr:hypothetical protein [Acidiferrobacterales bacterium]
MEIKNTSGDAEDQQSRSGIRGSRIVLIGAILLLAACETPPPPSAVPPPAASPPSVEVYFYPTKGQSKAQQDRDRYECYLWAK